MFDGDVWDQPGKCFESVGTDRDIADRPRNAILMRSDIHDVFDGYQFSYFHIVSSRKQRLPSHRLERDGAPSLPKSFDNTMLLPPMSTIKTPDCNWNLLRGHFITSL
ncbi:hypothetical protein C8J56DRAFT_803548 [Mycena floridula]|nr:hypothetical protein C8J56DRAFT_803548 [Mycena floridula]